MDCPYYKDIIVHSRLRTYVRLSTPDMQFNSFSKLANYYDMTIAEVHRIFDNTDKPILHNSVYFPDLKVGVVPKYIGFKNDTYYTGT